MPEPLTDAQLAALFRLWTAQLRLVLTRAQEERHLRPDLVTVDGQPECEWAMYERNVMHAETNRLRATENLPPVPLAAIVAVEQQAVGHSDYTAKYASGCAELILKEDPK
jgi:hypothetical protein